MRGFAMGVAPDLLKLAAARAASAADPLGLPLRLEAADAEAREDAKVVGEGHGRVVHGEGDLLRREARALGGEDVVELGPEQEARERSAEQEARGRSAEDGS